MEATGSEVDPASGRTTGQVELEGTWTVDTTAREYSFDESAGSFVGFRIDEELSSIGANTAVGRTPAVSGEITVERTTLTAATVTADLTELATDESRRDDRTRGALGVSTHPNATFVLFEPLDLGTSPEIGETFEATVVGQLTVNGVANPVQVPIEAVLTNSAVLVITGSFEVALADHVEAPTAPVVLSVADTATAEIQLFLTKTS